MSTVMLTQPAAASTTPASPTKKRRRRAPATGAAEDCFSCRSAGIKCDRRRPYCGPCLDSNQTCKGYRTQLTWGVGVASRGKLRGMSLPVLNAATEQQRKDRISKKQKEGAEGKAKKARAAGAGTPGAGTPNYGGNQQRTSPPSTTNVSKLSVITSYDFVNMEPPSSSATSRAPSSAMSATPQSAISVHSPALSARAGLPSSRSPPSGISSPYSAVSQPPYCSPVLPHPTQTPPPQHQQHQQHQTQQQQQHHQQQPLHHHQQHPPTPQAQQQHYQTSPPPSNAQYHKSPYSHVSLPQQQAPSILLSPMSEYEPSFNSGPHPHHYPISSAPSSAPMYEMVSGVSSASYHGSPSMTATSSGVSYTSMTASAHAPAPRIIHSGHVNPNGQSWNGPNIGVGNLHHQHVPPGHNLSDMLYDEDMLAQAPTGPDAKNGIHPADEEDDGHIYHWVRDVIDAHETLIRERCPDVQRDVGLFNKFSGLDALERIWKEDDDDEESADGLFAGSRRVGRVENRRIGGRGLCWRKIIASDEMEYLMV